MFYFRTLLFALLAAFLLGDASPSFAGTVGRPTGILVSASPSGENVEFVLQMTTTGTALLGTYGSPVGHLGNRWSFQYLYASFLVTNLYILRSPVINAFDFGNGTVVPHTTLSMVPPGPPNVFTGSFLHTYPEPGNYTMTASAWRPLGPVATVAPASPGTHIIVSAGAFYSRQTYLLPTFPNPGTFTGTFPSPFAIGVAGSTTLVAPNVTIPTLGEFGLILLSLFLAVGGICMLRR